MKGLAHAVVAAICAGWWLASAVAHAADMPRIPHEVFTLPSGLEVVLVSDRSVPLVAVDIWYHVGSSDEVPGKSGFAHLFEHMMFQGAKHIGEDAHFAVLKKAGASDINGTTSTDRTNYHEQVPSHQLDTALWLESDRMGWLLDTLNQKSLDNQREVVRNERRQRHDNVPYGGESFALAQLLYPEGHPRRFLTIGRHEDLQAASLADVQAFFRQWYAPSNATLCLAGDFEVGEAKAAVQKWFGTLPKVAAPQHKPLNTPQLLAPQQQTLVDPLARLERIHMAWHSPALYQAGDAELDLAAAILGLNGSGRLNKRLVAHEHVAQSVHAYQVSLQDSSEFHLVIDLRPGVVRSDVMAEIDYELQRLRKEPPSEQELKRAVLSAESHMVWGLEELTARCELLQAYRHYLGKTEAIAEDMLRYRNATPQSVAAVVARVLDPQRRVTVFTVPQQSALGGVP